MTTVGTVEPDEALCGSGEQLVVTAFEAETGAVRWISCSAEPGARWMAGASDDLVYLTLTPTTSNGVREGDGPSLVALDTRTGKEQWRNVLGQVYPRIPSGPFPGNEVAVVVLTDGSETVEIVGLDPATGKTIWTTSGTNGGYATDDDVVVGGGSTITAFDRATGEQRWSVAQRGGYSGYSNPVIADGMVIMATDPGAVALDLQTGEERWRTTSSPRGVPGGVEDGILVWSGQDDPTSGVDVATGEVLWTQPGHSTYDDVFAIGDGAVYVFAADEDGLGGSTATAYEVATGETRWRHSLGPDLGAWPFVANDDFVVAVDPAVLVLSTDDGSARWSIPVVGQTHRYIGAVMNGDTVFVIGEASQQMPDPSAQGEPTTQPDVDASNSVRCAGGESIGGFSAVGTHGETADVLASTDRTAFCVVTPDGTEDVIEVQPDRQVTEPEASTVAGTLAIYVHLTVPPTWNSAPLEITDGSGQQVFALAMPDGVDILVIDTAVTPDAPPESYAERQWTVSRNGEEIGEVTVRLPSSNPTEQMMEVALACLQANGVNVAAGGAPGGAAPGLDPQPLDPAIATVAWAACRSDGLALLHASGASDPEGVIGYLDCMAGHGFIAMFMGGEFDEPALAGAASACRATTTTAPTNG